MNLFYEQFSAFIADFKARRGLDRPHAQRRASPRPAPRVLSGAEAEAARRELAELRRHHDSSFEYADDYTSWARGHRETKDIARLRQMLGET